MSLGTVIDTVMLREYSLYSFRRELEKTGLFSGGDLLLSPAIQIDHIVSELIRLRAEEKARKEKEERIKNVKVGDEVSVFGFGKIETIGDSRGQTAFFGLNPSGFLFVVAAVRESSGCVVVRPAAFDPHGNTWMIYRSQIAEVSPAPIRKVRGSERRRVSQVSFFGPGSDMRIVYEIESAARFRSLSEDETEVLKAAQSRIREDRTANGFRNGGDRRINGQF